jgi:hypothetical protein
VVEPGHGEHLALEARERAGRCVAVADPQDLQGDHAIELGIVGSVDLAHAAGADPRAQRVSTEAVPERERRSARRARWRLVQAGFIRAAVAARERTCLSLPRRHHHFVAASPLQTRNPLSPRARSQLQTASSPAPR